MKNKNLVESFNNAINGILYAIKTERNMKLHITAGLLVIVLSLFYELTRIEFIIVCLTISVVIICELFNTAIELIIDHLINEYSLKAKIIKDLAAGAVFISALASIVVAYFIFFDRVSSGLKMGIIRVKESPIHVTIIAITVTVIFVLIIKAFFKKGTPFRGGMPSGHAAVAFSVTTAIALWTGNAAVTLLSLMMSLLLVQSRLEGKIHSVLELVAGSLLGFLVTLLLFQLLYK
jgi:diacylglycerol kinase (ATP)